MYIWSKGLTFKSSICIRFEQYKHFIIHTWNQQRATEAVVSIHTFRNMEMLTSSAWAEGLTCVHKLLGGNWKTEIAAVEMRLAGLCRCFLLLLQYWTLMYHPILPEAFGWRAPKRDGRGYIPLQLLTIAS